MANGDFNLGSGYTDPPSDTETPGDSVGPSAGYADQPEPEHVQPGVTGDDSSDKQINDLATQSRMAFNDYMTSIQKRSDEADQIDKGLDKELANLKQGVAQIGQMPQPAEIKPPPQYTDEQKGNVAQGWVGLLKVGAIMALAFGMRGRGAYRNSLYKAALGSFLQAYSKGMDQHAENARALWEKNWQLYKEEVTAQNQRLRDIAYDKRLELTQKMDIWKAEATAAGAKRDASVAERKDLSEQMKLIDDRINVLRGMEKDKREHTKTLFQGLGKTEFDQGYGSWVFQQPGGQAMMAKPNTPENEAELASKYPFTDYVKWKQDEDRKAKLKQQTEEGEATSKREFELHKKEKEWDEKFQSGQDPDAKLTPGAPLTDAQKKKVHDDMFGPSPTPTPESDDSD